MRSSPLRIRELASPPAGSRSLHRAPRRGGRRSPAARLAAALAAVLLASCAGVGRDVHLAPLFTELSTAGGAVRTEALGGAVILRRPAPGAAFDQWGLRPLFLHDRHSPQVAETDFLTPLGWIRWDPGYFKWRMLPLARYHRIDHADGTAQWTFLTLLGIYVSRFPDGRVVRAWFPFAGVVEGLLSFDRMVFVLWPLYMEVQRGEITTRHVLFPFFAWTEGEGADNWHVWPLIGRNQRDGSHDRWFLLWPFFQYHRDNLKARPYLQSTKWVAWPLVGRHVQGSFQATSVLWPFFGYSSDTRSGYWALDAPWFLVRIQRPGDSGLATITRLRPFYSSFEDERLTSRWYLWPVANRTTERYADGTREALHVIPFWQRYVRRYDSGRMFEYEKLWPLYKREQLDGLHQLAFPALIPFWRTPRLDRMYSWMWELYTVQRGEGIVRQRSFLGLWRRERDEDEDRRHLSGLWSHRRYTWRGEPVSETSLLFGLIRWRSGPAEDSGLMAPAFPGPGWPLERVPSTASLRPAAPPRASVGETWYDFP